MPTAIESMQPTVLTVPADTSLAILIERLSMRRPRSSIAICLPNL